MKIIRTIAAIVATMLTLAQMQADEDPEAATPAEAAIRAEEAFAKGLTAYQAKKWKEAEGNFLACYAISEHSETACLLSSVYVAMRDPRKVLEFSTKALEGKPTLPSSYKRSALAQQAWAREAVNDGYYLDMKADDPLKPKAPKVSAPRLLKPKIDISKDHVIKPVLKNEVAH